MYIITGVTALKKHFTPGNMVLSVSAGDKYVLKYYQNWCHQRNEKKKAVAFSFAQAETPQQPGPINNPPGGRCTASRAVLGALVSPL